MLPVEVRWFLLLCVHLCLRWMLDALCDVCMVLVRSSLLFVMCVLLLRGCVVLFVVLAFVVGPWLVV